MKTPMQELIEWMSKVIVALPDESVGTRNQMIIGKMKAESLLEKEKEVIMDAYGVGSNTEWDGDPNWMLVEKRDYYNETFNTKER